jgi:gliding motility-associated-like protein
MKKINHCFEITLLLLLFGTQFSAVAQLPGGCPTCNNGMPQNCTPIQGVINAPPDPKKYPKAGDELCTATKLKTGLSCTQFTVDTATNSTANAYDAKPGCWAGNINRDVWLSFIATAQDMTISTDAILFNLATTRNQPGYGVYDTQIQVYQSTTDTCTGSVSAMPNGCNDDAGINNTFVPIQTYGPPKQAVVEMTGLIPGKKYFIRVNAGSGATGGNFCISAFDTYTPGSKPCEAQVVHPNNVAACGNSKMGNTVVNWTSTNSPPYSTDGIQPNAYVPIDPEYLACAGLSAGQYGTWTKFQDSAYVNANGEIITNLSGGTRVYSFFSSTTCLHLTCMGSYTVANNASTPAITGLNKGTSYYILTTLLPGDMTQTFTTTLCVQNGVNTCFNPPTPKNLGGVAGAGGNVTGGADNYADAYAITQKQVYITSTYCKNADGATIGALGQCNQGVNVWFSWQVPPTYPCPGQSFFQMWNKNCTGGPLNGGTDMPVATCTSNSQCYNFSEPSQNPKTANYNPTGHLDWSTNVGWDPNSFSCQYYGIFTGHNNEVCDFNFEVNDSPSLAGVEATQATICVGGGPVTVCGKYATGYEWSTGETTTCITVNPSVSSQYTVTATAGADGYDVAYVTVVPLPVANIKGDTVVCQGVTSPIVTFTGKYASKLPYIFTYNINGAGSYTIASSGPALNMSQSATLAVPTGVVGPFSYNLVSVKESSSQGCSQLQPDTAVVQVKPLPTATVTGTIRKCLNDAPNPKIYFTGSGGVSPYVFTYKLGAAPTNTVTTLAGGSIDSSLSQSTAAAGVYTYSLVSVKDALGCSQTLPSNATTNAVVTVDNLQAGSLLGTTKVCQNSAPAPLVTFVGAGGSPAYTFTYNINGTNATATTAPATNSVTSAVSTATVNSYVYTVTKVTDGGGLTCNSVRSVSVTVTSIPTATLNGTVTKCLGDPSPPVVFTGGTTAPPYTFSYTINDGTTTSAVQTISTTSLVSTVTVPATTTLSGTFTYSLTGVTDGTGCSQVQSGSYVVNIKSLGATVTTNTVVCQNSTSPLITFTGVGGVAPYVFTYNIGGAASQTLTTTGGLNTQTVSVPTAVPSPTVSVYTLTGVQDNAGVTCNTSGVATITVNALPTAAITGSVTVCLNAPQPNILFTGAGTSDPYTFTYSLNDGTTTTVKTVSSLAGSSTVTVPATTTLSGTFTYSLMSVKDGTSATCSQSQTGSQVIQVNPLKATLAGTTTVCQNNPALPLITFTGSGGVPPYTFTYTINDGTTQTTNTIPTGGPGVSTVTVAAPTGVTGNFVYAVTSVQDANLLSCVTTPSVTITVSALPTATITGNASRCLNDPNKPVITFVGSGTTAPYLFTYSISDGTTTTINTVSGSSTATVAASTSTGGTFTYSLMSVADGTAQNCSQTQTGTAVIQIFTLTASTAGTTVVCKNTAQPLVTFTGAGGTAPYTFKYLLNGVSLTTSPTGPSNSITFSVSTAVKNVFTYSVLSITDGTSLNCPSVSTETVTINDLPNAKISGQTATCQNTASPNVTFTGSNTTGPYTINYTLNGAPSTALTSAGATGTVSIPVSTTVTPGSYTYSLVSVSDAAAHSCSNNLIGANTFTIYPLPTGTVSTTTPAICQDMTGSVIFAGAVGKPPYKFYYHVNSTAQTITTAGAATTRTLTLTSNSLQPGAYVYALDSVSDVYGCTQPQAGAATVTVTVYPLPTAAMAPTSTICATDIVTVTASSSGNNINWTKLDGTGNITAGVATNSATYTPALTDAGKNVHLKMTVSSLNCVTTASAVTTIVVRPALVANLKVVPNKVCQNQTSILNLTVTAPGKQPYTFTYTEGIGGAPKQASTINSNIAEEVLNTTVPTSPQKTPYMLTRVQDANGCYSVPNSPDSLLIFPLPVAELTGGGAACKDSIAPILTFMATVGTPKFYFTFDVNGKNNAVVNSKKTDSVYHYKTSTAKVGTFVYSLISVQDANCSNTISGQSQTVVVGENPQAIFTINPEKASILDPIVEIKNQSVAAQNYLWTFGDKSAPDFSVNPPPHSYASVDTGTYRINLLISTANGKCKDSTYQTVRIYSPLLLYVPNSFSPNGDGLNDELKAEGDGFTSFQMMIFDRWGQLVFESNDINKGWNGKANGGSQVAQLDSYVYVINLRAIGDKHDYTYRGVITLIK